MLQEIMSIRNIRGRYPACGTLKSENLIARVVPLGPLFVIRVDDEEHLDAWFEITVEILLEEPDEADDSTALSDQAMQS